MIRLRTSKTSRGTTVRLQDNNRALYRAQNADKAKAFMRRFHSQKSDIMQDLYYKPLAKRLVGLPEVRIRGR